MPVLSSTPLVYISITNNTVGTVRVSAAFDGSDVGNAVDVSFTFTSKTINFKGSIYKTMKSPSTGRIPPVVRLLPLASLACMVIVEVVVSCVLTPYELASKVEFAAIATTTGGESSYNSKVGNTVDIRFTIPEIDDDSPPVVVAIAARSTLEASSYGVNTNGTTTSTITFNPLKRIVFEVNVKLISTALFTSEPSKAALTLTVSTVLLVIVAV
jgi:hypothetical protein